MNKEDMVAIATEGFAGVANHMVAPGKYKDAMETGTHYTQDIEKAKALMAEAGYADGFTATIQAISGANNRYGKMAEVLLENLAEIGITATIEMGESATYLASWKQEQDHKQGAYVSH